MTDFDYTTHPGIQALKHVRNPLCIFDVDHFKVLWANQAGLAFWHADSIEHLREREIEQHVTEPIVKRLQQLQTDCFEQDISLTELWTIFPGGASRTVEHSFSPFPIGDETRALLIEVVNEIFDASSDTLRSTAALLHTSAMISLYDADHSLIYCNPAARESLHSRCTTLPQRFINDADIYIIEEALELAECYTTELEVNTTTGPRWHEMTLQKSVDPVSGQPSILVSAVDATERRQAQQTAYKLAYTDSLTGLPNRAALTIYLDELLSIADEEQNEFSLFFLDLDRFKIINDSLGHSIGDQLLIEVAHRLKQAVGGNSMASRLGGDEFVLIMNRVTDTAELKNAAEKILKAMAEPVMLGNQKLRILPSIGICRFPFDGETIASLMENADAAMYMAKARQCGYCFFDKQMTITLSATIKDKLGLENDLVYAIRNHEFELYYQPKISCRTGHVSGVEALIRWNHPTRGLVPPDSFITIAEETGQILELGNWVLDQSMRQQKLWQEAGLLVPVSINISAHQFNTDDLMMNVSECLVRNSCDPAMIELEITESMLLGDADRIHQTLQQLSAMGIQLTLDDFGTGYSNLAYLQKYPLDILKIDRAFLVDQKRSMLMETILNMGKVLGLKVVAEGVEVRSQVDWLINHGCDQMQGFYFSEPLPVHQVTHYLEKHCGGAAPAIKAA
ncbi:putative bifunctional diguanylate cyclase/phosphodiesterase [Granulosicoccus sp. 3-233]|uniref:putative bifunctional diguanylate cyclase/phosphodiesterase n=1 Tax=Granulosicoccus sp. 3-233 TaxID=3417969 RepID=UPI003D33DA66